uniref:YfbK domain-containing protein n=1 Tax=Tabrizicola caldifontis TaxID=2528036 RepID=UPI001081E934|nr:von Willebrand factor type A domain-containing protein [Rhodobacter sp. YIM 73028]
MTDDLETLRAALKSAPAPEYDAKTRALRLAMQNFDRLHDASQGSAEPDLAGDDPPQGAVASNGVRRMLGFLTLRPVLAVTTSTAALVIGVAVILPMADLRLPGGSGPVTHQAPEPALATDTPTAKTAAAPDGLTGEADSRGQIAATKAEPMAEALAAPLAATDTVDVVPPPAPTVNAPGGLSPLRMAAPGGSADGTAGDIAAAESIVAPLPDMAQPGLPDTEAHANVAPNPVKVTVEDSVSTFPIDVDTASWALIRSSLNRGKMPAPDRVRIEEMVNYFPYAYSAPTPEATFSTTVSVMPTPWNPGTRLVTIGIQGALPAMTDRPPLNLVFLIDTSGSMGGPDRLRLLTGSLALMLPVLRPEDQLAIVAYAGSAGLVLPPTAATDSAAILAALDNLAAGGATAGGAGLELAYQVAEGMKAEGEISRILLATDGDFNMGTSDPDGIEALVAKRRETGTYMSVLGFGRGNLDDAKMQALAQNGNGRASHIETLSEARKALADQLTGALFPIADDVKIEVEWNPAKVAEYRLIGYESRALRRENFNNDRVDAGQIGAGTQVTAIYEVTAPGPDSLLNNPLRYGPAAEIGASTEELGFLRLRWKAPGAETSTLIETPITGLEEATEETRFAAAIAGFGQLLQGSAHLGNWGWDQAIDLAARNRGDDPFGYRAEALKLMRLAQSLAAN